MVHSMTAFARTERAGTHGTLSWELRSVNHRYLEPQLRLPEAFRDLIERSLRLQNRVALLDREIYRPQEVQTFQPDNQNSVQAQLNLLQTAFGNN